MTSRTFETAGLILLSLFAQGLLPPVQGFSRGRGTSTSDQGHFPRDLKAGNNNDISNDESNNEHNIFERPTIRSESDFVAYCESWFKSSQQDPPKAFVSQGDLVDFLVETCSTFDEEDLPEFDCPVPTFTSIAVDVQLVFVKHLCNVKVGEEMVECLKSIVDSGREFGYRVDLTKSAFVGELCCGLLPFLELVGLEQNSDCPRIPNTVPTSHATTTPIPDLSGRVTPSPIEMPHQAPSFASPTVVASEPSPTPSPMLVETSTSVPTKTSNALPPSRSTPSPILTSFPAQSPGPTPNALPPSRSTPSPISISFPMQSPRPTPNTPSSTTPVAGDTPVPTETSEPSSTSMPFEVGSPVASNNEGVNANTSPDNDNISVATIAGLALGFGGLCIMGVVSSRRRARKREEAELTDSTPEESSAY